MYKMTLAILGLVINSFVFAGTMSSFPARSCIPGDLTVPCEASRWDIGVQALYLKPVYSAGEVYEYASAGIFKDVDKWDWGYRIEGSYHFNTGNDLTMNWSHYDVDSNHSGYAGLDNKFDQVNLVMGQQVDMGLVKNAHFYGGLQYAKILVDKTNSYLTVPPAIAAVAVGLSQYRNRDFNGVGPVIGVDYSYDLPYGLSLTADAAGSILYGTARYSSGFVFSPSNLVQASVYASKKAIVPSLEAKLGLNYAHGFAQGILNFVGGYQVINYFDVIETRGTAGFSAVASSNFGLFGPYFGLKWIGNL